MAKYKRPDPQTEPSKSKASGLYMICTISKHEAERKGFADALMLDWRGQIAEATGANVFFVKDGVLHTPTPDCFLDGITRRTVIELAKARGMKVVERAIMPEEMSGFSECFLTGTAAEVTPVSEIAQYRFTPGRDQQDADGRLFGRGDPEAARDGGERVGRRPVVWNLEAGSAGFFFSESVSPPASHSLGTLPARGREDIQFSRRVFYEQRQRGQISLPPCGEGGRRSRTGGGLRAYSANAAMMISITPSKLSSMSEFQTRSTRNPSALR